jgi:hypothetical protein
MCYTRPLVIVRFRIGVGWFREKGRGLLRKDEVRNSRIDSKHAPGKARRGSQLSSALSLEPKAEHRNGDRQCRRKGGSCRVRGLDNGGGNLYQQQQGLNAGQKPLRRDVGGADNEPAGRFGLRARGRHALQCRHAAWYSRTNLVTIHKIGRTRLGITASGHQVKLQEREWNRGSSPTVSSRVAFNQDGF